MAGIEETRSPSAIAQGQRDGVLDDAFPPLDVLHLLIHQSMGWFMAIEMHGLDDGPDVLGRRRAAAVLAAERLFPAVKPSR